MLCASLSHTPTPNIYGIQSMGTFFLCMESSWSIPTYFKYHDERFKSDKMPRLFSFILYDLIVCIFSKPISIEAPFFFAWLLRLLFGRFNLRYIIYRKENLDVQMIFLKTQSASIECRSCFQIFFEICTATKSIINGCPHFYARLYISYLLYLLGFQSMYSIIK